MAREDGVRFMGYGGLVFDGRTLFVAVAGFVAALLVWGLLAAPALAQDANAQAGDAGAQAGDVDFQAVDCSQVQAALAGQYNSGDAVAIQYGSADATASIAQELGISQEQANACLSGAGDVDSSKGVKADTISKIPLPDTGGMPLPAAVFGLALAAAGLLSAGSIIRRGR
jgi:hypothetical protein